MSIPDTSSHNRTRLLIGGGLLLLLTLPFLLSLIAFSRPEPPDPTPNLSGSTKPPARIANLEVLSTSGTPGAGPWSIIGKIRNNTTQTYATVQVSVKLFDRSGHLVGSTMTMGKNVQAGKVWAFTLPVSVKNVYRFEVVDVMGF